MPDVGLEVGGRVALEDDVARGVVLAHQERRVLLPVRKDGVRAARRDAASELRRGFPYDLRKVPRGLGVPWAAPVVVPCFVGPLVERRANAVFVS